MKLDIDWLLEIDWLNEHQYKKVKSFISSLLSQERQKLVEEIEKEIGKAEKMEGEYKNVELAIHSASVLYKILGIIKKLNKYVK